MKVQTSHGPLAYLHGRVVPIVGEGKEAQVVVADRLVVDLGGMNQTLLTL